MPDSESLLNGVDESNRFNSNRNRLRAIKMMVSIYLGGKSRHYCQNDKNLELDSESGDLLTNMHRMGL